MQMEVGISECIPIFFISCRTWHSSNIYAEGAVFTKESKYQDFHFGASNVFIRQPPSAAWRWSSQVWSKDCRCYFWGILYTENFMWCYLMLTVRWHQGCHLWIFPTSTWWIKPGSLGAMRKVTTTLKTSSPTSHRVASPASTASPCPGSCCMITVPWGYCTLCRSTEGKVMPKFWSAPWPGGSGLKVFQSTVS